MNIRIDPDTLVVPELYKIYTDKKYPVDEAVVEKCLDPSVPFEHQEGGRWLQPSHAQVIAILRSSILHVVSANETTKVLQSAGEYPMPEHADKIMLASMMQVITTIYNLEETITK